MGELRFILLLAGLVFLVALAAWELRKPRQAQGDSATRDSAAPRGARPRERSEPQMGSMGDSPAEVHEGRRPVAAPQRIDMPELLDLPAMEAMRAESILADADAMHAFETLNHGATDALAARADEALPPGAEPEPAAAFASTASTPTTASTAAAAARPATLSEPVASGITMPANETAAAAAAATAATAAPSGTPAAVLDWPPEGERHIVALRIVPAANERLSGRAVRLAITACGFVHGRFGIYHQADDEGRALLSVASLSKPGVLDPINLDFQRLAGINLFTVLPGPLSPGAALDHLLDTARELSQRLPARVQDETGHPLDAERLEDLRERMQNLA
jgi:FtsZ-interacting cell division protein ZipA